MKGEDSFQEYEEHLIGDCDKGCFYCGREEDILEQRYKQAKKMGEITWEEMNEYY